MSHQHLIKTTTNNKQYIIPDIHGCYNTLKALIEQLNLTTSDEIFFLGDYIDRGPRSREVIDFIIELKKKHNVYCLKGNHEEWYEGFAADYEYEMKDKTGILLPKYKHFFDELYYYIELDSAILVHASINFNADKPFEDYDTMLWHANKSMYTKNHTGKRIIRGHSRKPINHIKEQIANGANVIPLDNGCYKNREDYKYLCCLEISEFKLTTQAYCD